MNQRTWSQRRDVLICIICGGIIAWAGWNIVVQFIEAIFLLLISMAIAFLIMPVVDTLEKARFPRIVATLAVYLIILAVIGGFGYVLVYSFVTQLQQFASTVDKFINGIPDTYSSFILFLENQAHIPPANIQATINQASAQISGFATTAVNNLLSTVLVITNALLDILIVIVLSFYLTLDGKRIRSNVIGVIPQRSVSHVMLFEDALNRVVGNYIRGQLTLAVIVGFMTAIFCFVTGLGEFALIFGVLGFLFETIPMIGPFLASVSPIIVSLLLPDPFPRTLILVGLFVLLQVAESNILGPRIVGHAVGLHPVASIMSLLVFAKIFGSTFGTFGGAVGALVATPLVAAVWVVIVSLYRSSRGETPDQIMARRRAPWALRRPTLPATLRSRSPIRGSGRIFSRPYSRGSDAADSSAPKDAPSSDVLSVFTQGEKTTDIPPAEGSEVDNSVETVHEEREEKPIETPDTKEKVDS
jgi:predicted PurR-regulated permease PerM